MFLKKELGDCFRSEKSSSNNSVKERPELGITVLSFGELELSEGNVRNLGKKLKREMKEARGNVVIETS